MKPTLLLCLSFFSGLPMTSAAALPNPAHTQANVPGDWEIERMDLTLFINPEDGELVIEGGFEMHNAGSKPAESVQILLRREFVESFLAFDGVTSVEVQGSGKSANIPSKAKLLSLKLNRAVAPGASHSFAFAYECSFSGNQFAVKPDIALCSWVEKWYPLLYRSKPGKSRNTRLAGRTTFHMPADWHAVTNGELLERSADEIEAIETWESDLAVARSFIAGPYTVSEYQTGARSVGMYLLSSNITSAAEQARILGEALDAMEERFGPYPYPSFRIAEAPEAYGNWGASSEQGFIMCKPNFFKTEGGNLPLFAHEAAHGWWGNLVGEQGIGGILCSESLSQYGAVLAIEGIEGKPAAAEFLRFSRPGYIYEQCAAGYFELIKRGGDKPLSQLNGGRWAHTIADAKGHWFYHMLRGRVGDEVFFATLRGLIQIYTHQRMSLNDVRAAFLAAAPNDAGLERFLEQWLDRLGAPRIELQWKPGADHLQVEFEQTQKGLAFALDLELDFMMKDGSTHRAQVAIKEKKQSFKIPLSNTGQVEHVRMDPEYKLLIWRPEYEGYAEARGRASKRSGG